MPTAEPTLSPDFSFSPTSEPSDAPTAKPTLYEGDTYAPTLEPTFEPTAEPTFEPGTTGEPSSEPTEEPTGTPTSAPTYRVLLTCPDNVVSRLADDHRAAGARVYRRQNSRIAPST